MENENKFEIELSSDLDYEKLVININHENNIVAILKCDNGIDKAEIKIFDRYEEKVVWSFDCKSFIDCLRIGYEKLLEINIE